MARDDEDQIFTSGATPDPAPSGGGEERPSRSTPPPSPSSDQAAISQAIERTVHEGERLRQERSRGAPPAQVPAGGPVARPAGPQAGGPGAAAGGPAEGDQPPLRAPQVNEIVDLRLRAQTAERELAELRREREAAQAKQAPIDERLFSEPGAVIEGLKAEFAEQMYQMRVQSSFELAEVRHTDAWQPAFDAWVGAVKDGKNPELFNQVYRAQNPGNALFEWHRNQTVLREVGNDPAAYRDRLREELLNDPDFLEDMRDRLFGGMLPPAPTQQREARPAAGGPGQATPRDPQNGRFAPRHEVSLPPSLSRVNGAGRGRERDDAMDGSEEAIFDAGRAPRRR